MFLDINGHWVEVDDEAGYDLVIGMAEDRIRIEETARILTEWQA